MLNERVFALITFRKTGWLRFLGHLDVVRAMDRAIRRAKLPVAYSQGFSPHTLLSFAQPLPVGVAGEAELCGLELSVEWDPRAVYKALARQLPDDLTVTGVQMLPKAKRSPFADLTAADYRVVFADVSAEELTEAVAAVTARPELIVHRVTKSKELDLDLKDRIVQLKAEQASLLMRIGLGQDNLAKPEEVLQLLEAELSRPVAVECLTRVALYQERQIPFLPAL